MELLMLRELREKLKTIPNIHDAILYSKLGDCVIPEGKIIALVDSLNKSDITLGSRKENPVLIHLVIKGNGGDETLYVMDDVLREHLGGYRGTNIKGVQLRNSSEVYKDEKLNAWTRYLKILVRY